MIKDYIFLFILIMGSVINLKAQNVGIHTTTPLAKLHVDLGENISNGVLFTGTEPAGGTFPSLGAGYRFMFYPGRGILRAGYVDGTQWDNALVGSFSTAFGYGTIAKGGGSFAAGDATTASGTISSAFGNSTITKGYSSFVMGMYNDPLIIGPDENAPTPLTPLLMVGNGDGNDIRHNALTLFKNGVLLLKNPAPVLTDPGIVISPSAGPGTRMMWMPEKSAFRLGTVHNNNWDADSIGTWSIGMGYSTKAKGKFSLALGLLTTASGITSTALGYNTVASGENSISMGSVTTASGSNTSSLGFKTYARSYGSVSIGRYNDRIATSDSLTWIATDPLLIIGNGTSDASLHNMMVIYKNGNIISKNPTLVNTNPGVLPLPVNGPGTRMMWMPEKSAFRAGTVDNNNWDADSLGTWSVGLGFSTKAKGPVSFAAGFASTASGVTSTAFGYNTVASGENSISSGSSSKASGPVSTAMGFNTRALGFAATSMGYETVAGGNQSTAIGLNNRAMGSNSSVAGYRNISKGYASTVIGVFNDSILLTDQIGIDPITPLLIVGNGDGAGPGERRNAMVVRKDGRVGIGTNTPINPLSVQGNANVTGSAAVGIGAPSVSAQLDVSSTTKGFLPPRMLRSQRNAIVSPVAGLLIWCSNCGMNGEIQVFNGYKWTNMIGGATTINVDTIICGKSWMLKNLNVSTYRDGTPIPKVTDPVAWSALTTGAYCYYLNDSATYAAVYGKLYNWYAVTDPRGLAPNGWHIPTDAELETLSVCLGGSLVAGGQLKETGTTHWLTPNTGATNSTGFTGLPGGYRFPDTGSFGLISNQGVIWSSTQNPGDPTTAVGRSLTYNNTVFSYTYGAKKYGMSVRCLRD